MSKRLGRKENFAAVDAGKVVLAAEVVPVEVDEVILAEVVADVATDNWYCQSISFTLLLIQ